MVYETYFRGDNARMACRCFSFQCVDNNKGEEICDKDELHHVLSNYCWLGTEETQLTCFYIFFI